ncbi:MAG: primosomal protein N', partial [Pseudomonadales bacterium]|nr:primosomal protein N' [Pseudomonadales bacterium]
LVPEIGLTPQTVTRFTRRFSVKVVAMHSGLTDRERMEAWRHAAQGSAGIVIGTRSAVFTPLRKPGLIVVDEEHDPSFKQTDGFRYSARDLAVMRGHIEKLPVVLGSATPSLETLHNVVREKYGQLTLSHRPGNARPARYRIIDIRNRRLDEGFSTELIDSIKQQLADGNQVLVFLNRRGFAPVLLCHECGWLARCHRCDARLTWHHARKALICHHCGGTNRIPEECPECRSRQLLALGAGTERVEQTLSRMLPGQKIIRIDRDTTRKKDYMSSVVSELRRGEPAVLVGTQLLAKGHHFPDVTLAAILDMDSGFYSADFKAIERMGQLILQVGGRSGRASKPGLIAIQTHFPDAEILKTLMHEGYPAFAEKLLEERRENELPPWQFLTLVRAEATSRSLPLEFLKETAAKMKSGSLVELLGPIPSPMERRAGRYRAQLLISSRNRGALQRTVKNYIAVAEASSLARKVRWSIDVDPVDLF